MRRATLLSTALLSLLLFAGVAVAAEPAAKPTPAPAEETATEVLMSLAQAPAATPAVEPDEALCQFVEATKTNILDNTKTGYWCPPYSRYCRTNSQCSGYCGVGYDHWAVCESGCCACLG